MSEAPQITHHKDCYREHHACAVARLDRLREFLVDNIRYCSNTPGQTNGVVALVLVAVRDITEGRS